LETAYPYSAFGYYTGDFVAMAGLILGMTVFPAVLVLTARRLYALWGLLPSLLVNLWLMVGLTIGHALLRPW
jgi:fatty acid desaturase